MNRLYLVRHGENVANLTKEFSHRLVDYSLTEKGVLQAQQTAEYFRDKAIHAVYSSPLKRAIETAQIIAAPLGLPVIVLENFREVNVGELEGRTVNPADWALYLEITTDWLKGNVERCFPGGENYVQHWARFRAGIEQMIAERSGQNLILVGHGGSFMATLKDLCPDADTRMLYGADSPNCSITEILLDQRDGQIVGQLIRWSAYDHLSGAAALMVRGVPDINNLPGGPPRP